MTPEQKSESDDYGRQRRMTVPSASDENARFKTDPRPLIRAKDLIWLIYLYPVRWLATVLPLRLLYFFGDALAGLAPGFLRTTRGRLVERLRLAFPQDAGDDRIDVSANKYFRNAAWRFLDDLLLARLV